MMRNVILAALAAVWTCGLGAANVRAGPALMKACAAAVLNACAILENAAVIAIGGRDPRIERAAGLELFDGACAGGQPRACAVLGDFFREGLFGPADLARAAGLSERACALGNAGGCAALAEAYRTGRGVSRDAAQARAFAEKALTIEPHENATRTLRRLR